LRVSMLSGRYAYVVLPPERTVFRVDYVLRHCCYWLKLHATGASYSILHKDEVVPAEAQVRFWPGIRPPGEVSEYQLVVQHDPQW